MTRERATLIGLVALLALSALLALANPSIAHLLIRADLIAVAAVVAAFGLIRLIEPHEPSDPQRRWRYAFSYAPAEIPRGLANMVEVLRAAETARAAEIPPVIVRQIHGLLRHRLMFSHALDPDDPAHHDAVRAVLSPTALSIAAATANEAERLVVPIAQLPPLLKEIEEL